MATKTGKRPLRSLTAQEKLEAIRRVHNGESKASVARDIGVPESTLRGWCKNEDKISYLSRQSTPDTDDSVASGEPREKKVKLDDALQPFNLSLKSSGGTFSPNSENKFAAEFLKADLDCTKPLNLNKLESSSNHLSERERNRAELARLSIELGLNRPEMFLPNVSGNNTSLSELGNSVGLLTQWNNMLMQQQKNQNSKVTAPADTSTNSLYGNSLQTSPKVDFEQKQKNKTPKVDKAPSVDESVWYWLKQQAVLGLVQNPNAPSVNSLPTSTTTVSNVTSSSNIQSNGAGNDQNSSWFWKWYKQFANPYIQPLQQQSPDKPILYQQLTRDKDLNNTENFKIVEEKPASKGGNKARSVLDNLLFNNNNNVALNKKDSKDESLSQVEALEHGEKFLQWLECCSEPSVTTMQIMQFRFLLNNIKNGADKKNGDSNKIKIRRK